MSSNLGMATGELQQMHIEGGGESLWKEALKRLLKDKLAVMGGIIIALLVFLALFANFISPYDPNEQFVNGTSSFGQPLPIGASGKTITLTFAQPLSQDALLSKKISFTPVGEQYYTRRTFDDIQVEEAQYEFTFRDSVKLKAGQTNVTIPVNPLRPDMHALPADLQLKAVPAEDEPQVQADFESLQINQVQIQDSLSFVLGTDASGRDVLSRLIHGSKVSLQVGMLAVGLAVVIGSVLGMISGYFGGWVDTLVMRLTDIMMAFPDLLLVMAIVAVVNPAEIKFFQMTSTIGLTPEVIFICIAISVVSWTQYARLVRSQVLSVREMEFVEASRSLGARDTSIMFKHILPNVAAPVIVVGTMGIAGAIMTEAALSFLGFGVKVPTASWGSMINDGLGYFRDAPLIPLVPGLAIAITVFAFNLFGDGVRDALDPRLK